MESARPTRGDAHATADGEVSELPQEAEAGDASGRGEKAVAPPTAPPQGGDVANTPAAPGFAVSVYVKQRTPGPGLNTAGGHQTGQVTTSTDTFTRMSPNALGGPRKLPAIGTACSGVRATLTRIRFCPATQPLVGSNSTQPAPGR